ncbi:potassium channel family protein [Photobacterium aphoticum]|uniref:Potassium channel protein n=1 Tax=Photobacterium aphoticum TaxID=754436 RepID=A0A0J1GHE5_9GAMM|nr:potassium channel family protein [Photobacterium aphoticum]KLU99142.1 potassium channel protein [Photobacterium aphoticum]PSU59069.1 potassium channel protein [Photobacterium aphoticum]GHA45268.1 potassium channel protein [Photobacterium aphoticum]
MSIWLLFRRWAICQFHALSGRNLLLIILGYSVLSYALLALAGEHALIHSITDFIYYLVVTASTVGYGDMSPTTPLGKWIVMLFVIPGGLGLFAIAVGRMASILVTYWKRGLQGKRSLIVNNHILVLGWNAQRTLHLIKMLQHEERGRRPIVLCARQEIENPLPGEIEFVRVPCFTDAEGMSRAGIEHASCILIDNPEDDITLTAALYCASRNKTAHVLAYFSDEKLGQLLKTHCPNAECIPSVAVEMLAKAAVDPGSSELHHELLSTHHGMTQYAVNYPQDAAPTTVGNLFLLFKEQYEAILIAIDNGEGEGVELNPRLDRTVSPGSKLFYIADERVNNFNWQQL